MQAYWDPEDEKWSRLGERSVFEGDAMSVPKFELLRWSDHNHGQGSARVKHAG